MDKLKHAEELAHKYHDGQKRKKSELPFVVHPQNVVRLLSEHGITDEDVLCIAWLHDTLEDTHMKYEQLEKEFGKKVAQGVRSLTKDSSNEEYMEKLSKAPVHVQLIKIFDVIDNLHTLEAISEHGQEKMLQYCESFYIPMAERINPELAQRIRTLISEYEQRIGKKS